MKSNIHLTLCADASKMESQKMSSGFPMLFVEDERIIDEGSGYGPITPGEDCEPSFLLSVAYSLFSSYR